MRSRPSATSKRYGRCSPRTIRLQSDFDRRACAEEKGGSWARNNRPVSGAPHEKPLPIGRHPLQLYSLGTPNGVKVTVMLEELLALGHRGAGSDAWVSRVAA